MTPATPAAAAERLIRRVRIKSAIPKRAFTVSRNFCIHGFSNSIGETYNEKILFDSFCGIGVHG